MHSDMQPDEKRLSTEDIAGTDPRDTDGADESGMGADGVGVRAEENDAAPENGAARDEDPLELFGREEVVRFREEWRELQARFVDDPREAVQGADYLVAEVMKSLASTFSQHKLELEGQWQHGSAAETEDLRLALRRYRTFFNQLLNV